MTDSVADTKNQPEPLGTGPPEADELLNDDSILQDYSAALTAAKRWQEIAQRLEYEIIRRAQFRGATAIDSPEFEAVLKSGVTYDQKQL